MEIGWTDVGSRGYILVSCAHSNTSYYYNKPESCLSWTVKVPVYEIFVNLICIDTAPIYSEHKPCPKVKTDFTVMYGISAVHVYP